jgi:hypothetical protein
MKKLFFLILAVLVLAPVARAELPPTDYDTVGASKNEEPIGPNGAKGDVIERLIIVPATTGAGNVSIKDGSGAAISVFATGTLADLKPHVIYLGMRSTVGAWKVSTGANVSVIAIGRFK